MLSEADDYIEEREGGKLVIFQRSGIFQARIYRGKGSRGYIYRSLNTRDIEQARKAATKLWHQLEFKAEHGLPVTTYTMSRVIDGVRGDARERPRSSKAQQSYPFFLCFYQIRRGLGLGAST